MTDERKGAELADRACGLAREAAEAAIFVAAHPQLLGQPVGPVAREFRRHARRADHLREAAERPPAVAVFGASQAGKTYLVTRFAVTPGATLMIDFEGTRIDFLLDINPQGNQEATGLVTRFTTHPVATPPGSPVSLRLLSQIDVARILANTFVRDFQPETMVLPTTERLDALFSALSARAGAGPHDGLVEEDIDELAEYCERHFRQHSLIVALRQNAYWPRMREFAPRVSMADRAALFAPLWGEVAAFSGVFARLVRALASLGFADRVYTTPAALTPREQGILNVRTVLELETAGGETVPVTAGGGAQQAIVRSELAALVAELTLAIPSAPWAFLQRADLLDFPGARTREEIKDIDTFLSKPGNLGFAFLRGKVDYLFQRYNEERDIAAMLLCVGPSNQEVQTLPGMVDTWVRETLGETPERRAALRNSLFLVLTKFDTEFERKGGEDDSAPARWNIRLQASLLDFFGKAHDWPTNWTPGRCFDNLFWLRNTAVACDAVMQYAPDLYPPQEVGIAPHAMKFVGYRREGFLGSELVRRHFVDPEAAWEAGLAANDGGISRLAGALDGICDRSVKGAQIAARLDDLARAMADRLRPFWRSDDREAERARARLTVGQIAAALRETIRAQRFGPLLRAIQIGAEEMRGLIWRIEIDEGPRAAAVGAAPTDDTFDKALSDLFGEVVGAPAAAAQDYFDLVSDRVMAAWDEQLQVLAADGPRLSRYRLTPETARLLVGILTAGAQRLGLHRQIAQALRDGASFLGGVAGRTDRMALIAEDEVNGFVTWLGNDRSAGEPPRTEGGPLVFPPRPVLRGLPTLGTRPEPYDQQFNLDWLRALLMLAEGNATGDRGTTFDRVGNDALGALIRAINVT